MTFAGDATGELGVDARFAEAAGPWSLEDDAARFVRNVEYAVGSSWAAAVQDGRSWAIPCGPGGCRVRYRFALREASQSIADVETAAASGNVYVAPPSTWLLHPDSSPPGMDTSAFAFTCPAPARFGCRDIASAWAAARRSSRRRPRRSERRASPGLRSVRRHDRRPRPWCDRHRIGFPAGALALSPADVGSWIMEALDRRARWISSAAFRCACARHRLAWRGGSCTRGETLGATGPAVVLRTGSAALVRSTMRDDWVATPRADSRAVLPSLLRVLRAGSRRASATYVEPIARARVGTVTPEKMWGDLVEGIPQGLPEAGDEGLDRTHTWGRTYWGGALFSLVADVELRERTGNQKSLDDVLRAARKAGDDATEWEHRALPRRGGTRHRNPRRARPL